MPHALLGLDHVVVACADLDQAAADFTRLGFAPTPRGIHQEWGTANHCLMFGDGYVQLLAPQGDGAEAQVLRDFLTDRSGGHSLAFGSSDIAATIASLAAQGIDCPAPRQLSRQMQDDDKTVLRFLECPLPMDATPGLRCRLIQHQSAERLRHPHWLDHPNGALGIASVSAIVADPIALTQDWDRLFGPHSAVITDETVTVHAAERSLIFLSRPDDLSQLHPGVDEDDLPAPPALTVLTITVADPLRAIAILKLNKVEYSLGRDGTIRIPPWEAGGIYLELITEG